MMVDMILVERHDWLKLLLDKLDIDFIGNPMDLDELPVSHIFKGNLWRLIALCGLLEAKKATSTLISKDDLERIEG